MKPFNTLRQNLVHPKDKRPITDNAGVIYKIPCQQCPKSYIGETGRRFGIRLKEHKDEVDKVDKSARFTRSQRKTSESTYNRSALTDHSSQNNHIIDWDNSKLVGREDQWKRRQILETIRIQQEGDSALNRDGGNYDLPRLWTPLLLTDASIKPAKCNMHKAVSHNRKSSL